MLKEMKQLNGVLSQELQSATENLRFTEEKLLVTTKQLEDCKRRNLEEKLKIESEVSLLIQQKSANAAYATYYCCSQLFF